MTSARQRYYPYIEKSLARHRPESQPTSNAMDYLPQWDTNKLKEKTFKYRTAVLVESSRHSKSTSRIAPHTQSFTQGTLVYWDQIRSGTVLLQSLGNWTLLVSESGKLYEPKGPPWALFFSLQREREQKYSTFSRATW